MNGLSFLETISPNLNGNTDQKIQALANNLHLISEQMRYTIQNLGPENFNEASMNEMFNPIYAALASLDERVKALEGN